MATIHIEKLSNLKADADKIFLSADGEKVLIQLLEIQKQVEDTIAEAKQTLEAAALKANPNFASIQADNIKVWYRSYGAKFYIDETRLNDVPKELYETESKVTYKLDSKAIEKIIDSTGKIPSGIVEVERKKSLTFGYKKNKGGDNDTE